MSRHCQLTGAVPGFGRRVSHSNRRTSRTFTPNVQRKRYYVPSLGRTVRLTVTASAMKTIDRIGIEAAVARITARGERI
ncbi:MAG: 50S ribosomal protein L28 [Actinomycetaceae bacterium]